MPYLAFTLKSDLVSPCRRVACRWNLGLPTPSLCWATLPSSSATHVLVAPSSNQSSSNPSITALGRPYHRFNLSLQLRHRPADVSRKHISEHLVRLALPLELLVSRLRQLHELARIDVGIAALFYVLYDFGRHGSGQGGRSRRQVSQVVC